MSISHLTTFGCLKFLFGIYLLKHNGEHIHIYPYLYVSKKSNKQSSKKTNARQ